MLTKRAVSLLSRIMPLCPLRGSRQFSVALDEKDKVAQQLFYIRSSASTPADASDVWAVSPKKLKKFISERKNSTHLTQAAGNIGKLEELVKRPTDSLLTVDLPFGRDTALRQQYSNFRGQLRVGKLLEEIDAFAGNVAYLHCDDDNVDTDLPILVTVSTDRVDLLKYPLLANQDLRMKGMVTYVGSSSMNVDIDLFTVPTGDEPAAPVMMASLTFVARNAKNEAVSVPRLQPVSEFEKRLYEAGKFAQQERKIARKASLMNGPPTASELKVVHDLFSESLRKFKKHHRTGDLEPRIDVNGPRAMLMEDTRISSVQITQPQDRNLHGKTFGGNLMRNAFEIAWACGWNQTGVIPKFLALDDITFLHPVEVGSLLRFEAQMDFALGPPFKTYLVAVQAYMRSVAPSGLLNDEVLTNTFHFTFYCDDPSKLPRVYPRSYEDAMRYIEASRRIQYGQDLAEKRRQQGCRVRFE